MANEVETRVQPLPADWPADYLVIATHGGRSKTMVWNCREPLDLEHPPRWRLEKTPVGVIARELEGPPAALKTKRIVPILTTPEPNKGSFRLVPTLGRPGEEIELRFEPLKPLGALFAEPSQRPDNGAMQLLLFCGFGSTLFSYRSVRRSFQIHVENRLLFTFAITEQGNTLTSHEPGLEFHFADRQKLDLGYQIVTTITDEELFGGTIFKGPTWWRLRALPALPPRQFIDITKVSKDGKRIRGRLFAYATLVITAILFLYLQVPYGAKRPTSPQAVEVKLKPPQRKFTQTTPTQKSLFDPPRKAQRPPYNEKEINPAQASRKPTKPNGSELGRAKPEISPSATKNEIAKSTPDDSPPAAYLPPLESPDEDVFSPKPIAANPSALKVTGVGKVALQAVEEVLEANLPLFQTCYAKALSRNPSARGTLEMRWTVGKTGKVQAVSLVRSSVQDPVLAGCIAAQLRLIPFPKPQGGNVELSYPFVFASSD